MSDLLGNQILGFPTRRLISISLMTWSESMGPKNCVIKMLVCIVLAMWYLIEESNMIFNLLTFARSRGKC